MPLLATIFFATGSDAFAQSDAHVKSAIPVCKTSSGVEGTIFARMAGMIFSDVPFDDASFNNNNIDGIPAVRNVLAFYIVGQNVDSSTPPANTVVSFTKDQKEVFSCIVAIVEFDPSKHNFQDSGFGNCDLGPVSGFGELGAGTIQLFLEADKIGFNEFTFMPRGLAVPTGYYKKGIGLIGLKPGRGHLVLADSNSELEYILGICPFEVVPTEKVDVRDASNNNPPCEDVNGTALNMSIGQKAELLTREYSLNINNWVGNEFLFTSHPFELSVQSDLSDQDEPFEITTLFAGQAALLRERESFEVCIVTVK